MSLRDRLRADLRAFVERDPATASALEVLLTAPGLYALWSHRLAHWLYARGHRLLARTIATCTRLITGIEIHPGAELGERVVIDHGQGTVIGSTAVVGDDVLLYHGVTLGAREERTGKRHPTVGDDVTLGANATVLGDVTVGDGAAVGAGAVVVDPVEPDQTVVGVPARPVEDEEEHADQSANDAERAEEDAERSVDDAQRFADDAERVASDERRGTAPDDRLADAASDGRTAEEAAAEEAADESAADEEPTYPECVCEPPWP